MDAILLDIASGEPAYKASAAHGLKWPTFWYRVGADPTIADKYARAKLTGIERLAEEIIQIADESRRGIRTTVKADGSTETVDGDMVERARLQIESRKWLLAKLMPRKYGDNIDLSLGDGSRVIIIHSIAHSPLDADVSTEIDVTPKLGPPIP